MTTLIRGLVSLMYLHAGWPRCHLSWWIQIVNGLSTLKQSLLTDVPTCRATRGNEGGTYSRFAQSTHTSHYLTHHSTQTLHSPLSIYTYITTHYRTGLSSLLPHEDEVEEQANKSQHHSHRSQCWHKREQDDINQEYLLSWYPLWIQLMLGGEGKGERRGRV